MISLVSYLRETWSATPAISPVGVVSPGYQKIIDRNLRSGNNTTTLLKGKRKKMINVSEVITNVQALKGGGARFQVPIGRQPQPEQAKKVNIRPAHLRGRGAFIKPPDVNQQVGFKINQMRQKQGVGEFGDRMSSRGAADSNRKVLPGMAFANTQRNVPKVPIRR